MSDHHFVLIDQGNVCIHEIVCTFCISKLHINQHLHVVGLFCPVTLYQFGKSLFLATGR